MTAPRLEPPTARELDSALARGMLWAATFGALTATARIAQDAVIAWRFGSGPAIDAYTYLLSLVSLPGAVALSSLTLLLAPIEARGESPRWRAELLGVGATLALAIGVIAFIGLHAWIDSDAAGLPPEVREVALQGLPAMSLQTPLGLVGALLAAWLVAANRQAVTLTEALAPALLTATLIWTGATSALFQASTSGLALQVAAMALLLCSTQGLPRPRLGLSDPVWPSFAQGAAVMLVGQVLFALVPLVDPLFAAHLGEGALATLGYANRLVLGVTGLAGLALQRVGLPLLARATLANAAEARRVALRWAWLAAAAGVPIAALIALAADPLVGLLYQRGQFGAAEREAVAGLLRLGMLQLPLFLAGMAVVSAMAAASGHRRMAVAAALGLAVKLVASALLVPHWGAAGLVVASAIMYACTTLLVARTLGPNPQDKATA